MPTLAEIVISRFKKSSELNDRNLLGIPVNAAVMLDDVDYGGAFHVKEIRSVEEKANGKTFRFADYILSDKLRLRICPAANPDRILKYDALILENIYEAMYGDAVQDGLLQAVEDPAGIFQDYATNTSYYRRFGNLSPHIANAYTYSDVDGNGKVEEDEVEAGNFRYWDFENGNTLLFAEEDENGYFILYLGHPIPQEYITIC